MQASPKQSGQEFDVFASGCPSRQAFDQIFSRWGMLVLCRLSGEGTRFGMLRRSIEGISEKMLSQTLKTLEEEGLVRRREWDEKPPHVEYSLTEAGLRISGDVARLVEDLYDELGKGGAGKA